MSEDWTVSVESITRQKGVDSRGDFYLVHFKVAREPSWLIPIRVQVSSVDELDVVSQARKYLHNQFQKLADQTKPWGQNSDP
ncbi:hypothetical protein NCHU2750_17870 [Neorhizobium sp. NCHU2750]|nr:hypothetical protein NCHU2750_17870 [Neorhizobium sp. NCHU2750]